MTTTTNLPTINSVVLEKVINTIFRKKGYDLIIKINPVYPSDELKYNVLIRSNRYPVLMYNIDINRWNELRTLVRRHLNDVVDIMYPDKSLFKDVCLWISMKGK